MSNAQLLPTDDSSAARQEGDVWPGPGYDAQIAALNAHIGKTVYLMEVQQSDLHLAVNFNNTPLELLAVVAFPKPDPARGLLPHLIVLSDGRGLNLGRVARIALEQPFLPAPEAVVYQDRELLKALVHGENRLTRERIAGISRMNLADLLGEPEVPLLTD